MLFKTALTWLGMGRLVLVALVVMSIAGPLVSLPVSAGGGDRTLWLHHTHTGETARFTFRRNGQYDPAVLDQMNRFLADWRTKEPTHMDPALFDLIWEVYQEVGASQPVNIVSSYRAPKTNALLRKTSLGVAENSQHMRGKAMDIFIPGVPLAKLRETAMRHQVGGVGYYPTSGSPFVHVDTGNVRAWPRMTRAQLQKLFPDGRTLHLPTDGRPLSESGRAYALAEWGKCHSVPCDGAPPKLPDDGIVVAAVSAGDAAPIPADRPARFSTGPEPTQRVVATTSVTAPIPLYRPGTAPGTLVAALPGALDTDALEPPVPATKSARLRLATASTAVTGAPDDVLSAYAPESSPVTTRPAGVSGPAIAAGDDAVSALFDGTFGTLKSGPREIVLALNARVRSSGVSPRVEIRPDVAFVAPDLDHVNETLVMPVLVSTTLWADMTEAEGYLDKTTELGADIFRMPVLPGDTPVPAYDRFIGGNLVAMTEP